MIVNQIAKRGLFEYQTDRNEGGLMVYDFQNDQCIRLDKYKDWHINALSSDGKYVAINKVSDSTRGYRTDFAILEVDTQEEQYFTNAYFVYDAEFSLNSDKVLIVAHNKKPFCLDLRTKEIIAEMPKNIRTYQGSFNKEKNQFIAPSETFKDTLYLFDFVSGETEKIKTSVKEKISKVEYTNDSQHLIVLTESSIVYCLDLSYKMIWSVDFNTLLGSPIRINSSAIFLSEDNQYLMLEASSTETNSWGAEFVLAVKTGVLVNTVEGYQYRGRVKHAYFGKEVLLYTYRTLDMLTGEIKDLNLNI